MAGIMYSEKKDGWQVIKGNYSRAGESLTDKQHTHNIVCQNEYQIIALQGFLAAKDLVNRSGRTNKISSFSAPEHTTTTTTVTYDHNLRRRRLIWMGAAYRLAVVPLPPLTYVTSNPGYELDNQDYQTQKLQPVLPKLLQEILLKALAHAKEKLIGAARLGVCVLERFELERTDVIGNLGKAIACGRRITINNRLLGQCELNGIMQRLGNQSLPVVVIDLNLIELLQILKMVEQKDRNIPPDTLNRTSWREHVGVKLGLLIGKRHIFERKVLQKDTERCEVLLTFLDVHAFVPIVTIKQRREMKGDIPKSLSIQSFEVIRFVSSEPLALFMEHENYEVVLGFGARIAGFVYEYGKILHSPHASNNKNAGGKPPAVGGPPCGEDHLLYTTRRVGYSIIAKYEHMFSIVHTNTCSTYRKAA